MNLKKFLSVLLLLVVCSTNFACTPQEVIDLHQELFTAMCNQDIERLNGLLETPQYQQSIDVNMTNNAVIGECAVPGDTFLIVATKLNSQEMVMNVFNFPNANNIDINKTDSLGRNALHWAAERCDEDIIIRLIESGINRATSDNSNKTASDIANANCEAGIVNYINNPPTNNGGR